MTKTILVVPIRLHCASGTKAPARAAVSLVLYRANHAVVSPVLIKWNLSLDGRRDLDVTRRLNKHLRLLNSETDFELGSGKIGELIDSLLPRLRRVAVVRHNVSEVSVKDLRATLLFLCALIRLPPLAFVVFKRVAFRLELVPSSFDCKHGGDK